MADVWMWTPDREWERMWVETPKPSVPEDTLAAWRKELDAISYRWAKVFPKDGNSLFTEKQVIRLYWIRWALTHGPWYLEGIEQPVGATS